jgi:hypothetical protein
MNISQRLRTCAKHTGLDAVIELLQEAADEIDRLSGGQQSEVTDERAAFEAEMRCEDVWGHRSLKKRPDGRYQNWQVDLMWDVWQARAILALRPERVPMTREQVFASDELMAINGSLLGLSMCDLMQVIRIIEAHHGITAQAKKEDK